VKPPARCWDSQGGGNLVGQEEEAERRLQRIRGVAPSARGQSSENREATRLGGDVGDMNDRKLAQCQALLSRLKRHKVRFA
jgi:hypothetical protein